MPVHSYWEYQSGVKVQCVNYGTSKEPVEINSQVQQSLLYIKFFYVISKL